VIAAILSSQAVAVAFSAERPGANKASVGKLTHKRWSADCTTFAVTLGNSPRSVRAAAARESDHK
jgi:hypothetical protein